MTDPMVYWSQVRIERINGPFRRAYLPAIPEPVLCGIHSEVAEHYGVDTNVEEPNAIHADACPAAPTICNCVAITTSLEMENVAEQQD